MRLTVVSHDPTRRAEAPKTPETRRGWEQPRHPEPMGEGHQRQETGTGATVGGVRAEARRMEEAAGSAPGNAPAGPPPRPRAETYHVTGRHFDHELGCTVARGIGFSWRCTCGQRGRITADRGEALAAKREHETEHQR